MAQGPLPDPAVTPGALNPEVTQENIHETVCVKGWTASVRPAEESTYRMKRAALPPARSRQVMSGTI